MAKKDGSWERVFNSSVSILLTEDKLEVSVLHGDGSNTVAKVVMGYSGHQHQRKNNDDC
jgi:hypothetical protein